MQLVVRLFATLRDRVKVNQVAIELADGATVGALREKLAADYPALAAALPTSLVAVNREFAFADTPLHPGDEVALFPPVSGGTDWPTITLITPDALDVNQVVHSLTLPTTGAVVAFTGTVRGSEQDRQVVQLF